jgi:hypothetical protein
MIRKEKFYIPVLLAGLILTGPAMTASAAASNSYSNYGRIGLGVHDFSSSLDDVGYDAGVAVSATYGNYLTEYLVIEGTVSFFESDRETIGSTATAGTYTTDDTLGVGALLVTMKAEIPLDRVAFYGGVGVGGYAVALDSEIETTSLGDFNTDEDDYVLGAHVVAGGNFDITDRIFVGIEGMYRWTDDVDIVKVVGSVPISITDNLNGYTVSVTCGFRF